MAVFTLESDSLRRNSYNSIFWRVEIKEKAEYVAPNRTHCPIAICIILKGEIAIYNDNLSSEIVKKDEAALVTKPSNTKFKALSEATIIFCTITQSLLLNPCFSFKDIELKTNFNNDFNVLKINSQVKTFLAAMEYYLIEGIQCTPLHELKRIELFILFREFYSDSELISFFFPLINESSDFKDFI